MTVDSRKLANEGFVQITETEGVRYYFNKGEGNVVRGVLRGRFLRPKPSHSREPDQYFYEVRLTKKCETVTRSEMLESGETELENDASADVGEIVRVDETQRISQVIKPLLDSEHRYEIVIECVGRMKLKGGKSFWRMNAYARKLTLTEASALDTDLDNDGEAPF